ncbi:MAG: POTRA domain-containing protein [Candidatus Omnitrophota bacterium]
MASQIPPGQDVGSLQRTTEETKKTESVTKGLIEGGKKAEIENAGAVAPKQAAEAAKASESKVLIAKIEVDGVTVIPPDVIRSVVAPYEGKELSLSDFKIAADAVNDEYRRRGYVTTLVYLPPQKIENGILKIAVVEGKVGVINLTGNRYFTRDLIMSYIDLKQGDLFNYDVLRKDVNNVNEHPDRNAKIVLEKGAGAGETDVNIQLKDRMPIHATVGYNNYNSSYLGRNRYSVELKENNMFGIDHVASVEAQLGDDDHYHLYSGRYLMPITPRNKVGVYYVNVDQKLGGSVKNLNIEGRGNIAAIYDSYKLIDHDDFVMRINPEFDYKDIKNKMLGLTLSEDNVRVAKLGFDFDFTDRFGGRSLLTQEFDYGIPGFMGGLEAKDSKASSAGSGGKFFKSVTNAARIQTLPASASIMIRGSGQITNNNLVSTEQFNLGGPATVRGYPISELNGDQGIAGTAEVYIPPYFIPTKPTIPGTDLKYFNATKIVAFFDWGRVWRNNAQVGEAKTEEIYSAGPGLRFDIPNRFSFSFDYGFALGQKPSDGSKGRGLVETKIFF